MSSDCAGGLHQSSRLFSPPRPAGTPWITGPWTPAGEAAAGGDGAGPSSRAPGTGQPQASAAVEGYRASHRTVSKSWQLPAKFPDRAVLEAYSKPRVDTSKDRFQFSVPDVEVLRPYCQQNFGWTRVRSCLGDSEHELTVGRPRSHGLVLVHGLWPAA
jgi:hypothetical protein